MAAFTTNLPFRIYIADLLKWFVGAFILRSSACTINDIFDRHMDACVGQFAVCRLSMQCPVFTKSTSRANEKQTTCEWTIVCLRG